MSEKEKKAATPRGRKKKEVKEEHIASIGPDSSLHREPMDGDEMSDRDPTAGKYCTADYIMASDFPTDEAETYVRRPIRIKAVELREERYIKTLEGMMRGRKGDFLIQGVKGEVYPCKREIFLETYEAV